MAKPAAKPVAKKAAPVKVPAKKVAVKPVAPAKAAAKPAAAKPVPAKPTPAKPVAAAKPASKAAPAKPAVAKPAVAKPVPQKATAKPATIVAPTPPRPKGKVAVAVVSKKADVLPQRPSGRPSDYKVDDSTGRPLLPKGYRPTAGEEYMNPLQLEYFRQRLQQWRADLVEESKQTIENLKDEVRDIGDEAERATRETENSLELRTRDRYRKLIGKIDSTLKRLDGGDYGYCVDTGEEIGLERLEARLTAERTIDAQERWEHLQKQQGE